MFKDPMVSGLPKKEKPPIAMNPMIAAIAATVAPPVEKSRPQTISIASGRKYERFPPEYIPKEKYQEMYDTALDQEPLKDMGSELAGIEDLIKRRDEYKPDVLPSALLAGAQAFSDEAQLNPNSLKIIDGMIGKKDKNDLQKLQDMIDARKEKSGISQSIAALASKGVGDQIVDTKVVQSGEFETKSGDLRSPGSGKDNKLTKTKQWQKASSLIDLDKNVGAYLDEFGKTGFQYGGGEKAARLDSMKRTIMNKANTAFDQGVINKHDLEQLEAMIGSATAMNPLDIVKNSYYGGQQGFVDRMNSLRRNIQQNKTRLIEDLEIDYPEEADKINKLTERATQVEIVGSPLGATKSGKGGVTYKKVKEGPDTDKNNWELVQ